MLKLESTCYAYIMCCVIHPEDSESLFGAKITNWLRSVYSETCLYETATHGPVLTDLYRVVAALG